MRAGNPEVLRELRERIARQGRLTFAEFMEVALYWPKGGYYATRRAVGARGDFYSAPTLHPAFGALVARQLHEMWVAMAKPRSFWAVELGAGTGQLAVDITSSADGLDSAFARGLRYVAVDVHAPPTHREGTFDWLVSSTQPVRGVRGCVLANELLDAMPVHRLTMDGGELRELYVTTDADGQFAEVVGPPSSPALSARLRALDVVLPEGCRVEVNLGLESWMAGVAASLEEGYLLLSDYGHDAEAYYDPSRFTGTLRCYYQHTLNANPFQHVGEQDISVHVEFTTLRRLAEAHGLALVGETSQGAFLEALGLEAYRREIARRPGLGAAERNANLRALDTLADPQGMGAFHVLAFCKGVPTTPLRGFVDGAPIGGIAMAPLATPRHIAYVEERGVEMPTWDELLG